MSIEVNISFLMAEGLTKEYDGIKVVDLVGFEANSREIFGFLGSNGAGKTTIIDIIVGMSYLPFMRSDVY